MFNSGFLTLGSFAGAPIRFHWSVVILMLWFGRWHPGAWVGILVLVLMHELGHAMVVRAVRGQVTEVMVYGFGGYCAWRGNVSSRARAMIAWGGVWAQGVLLIAAVVLSPIINPAYDSFGFHLLRSLTTANIMLIVLNLIPRPPARRGRSMAVGPHAVGRLPEVVGGARPAQSPRGQGHSTGV